jgi:hypothetical protein
MARSRSWTSCVIHEGAGFLKGRLAVLTFVCGIGVVIIGIRCRGRGFGAVPRTSLQSCRARPVGSSAVCACRDSRRRWWRLTRRVESGIGLGRRSWVHGALVVGGRFADRVPAREEAPVIHSVALGGPECRAVLGGSINLTAVLLGVVERRPDTGASSPEHAPRAVVRASLVRAGVGHAASASSSSWSSMAGWWLRQRISPSLSP